MMQQNGTLPLQKNSKWRKMNGPEGASNTDPGPDHRAICRETAHMADGHIYPDSGALRKPEQKGACGWLP